MSYTKKILLGQLASRGDCLFATAIARQIKHDYPGCHLTWAIGSLYKSVIDNNPYVDEIWEIPLAKPSEIFEAWIKFEKMAIALKKSGTFDEVFLTQLYPNNYQHYDGTIRSSMFRCYPHPITVPISPVISLTAQEIAVVKNFAQQYELEKYSHVILFEYSSNSGQSFVSSSFAFMLAKQIVNKIKDVCIILSSDRPIQFSDKRIIDGSILSFKENAELAKYCTLLIGCSSGISWLCTSESVKQIPKIQLLKKEQSVSASMAHDFEFFGLSTENILEMTECQSEKIAACVECFILEGFFKAKQKFDDKIRVTFGFFFQHTISYMLLERKMFKKSMRSIITVFKRYGVRISFVAAFFIALLKYLIRLIYLSIYCYPKELLRRIRFFHYARNILPK